MEVRVCKRERESSFYSILCCLSYISALLVPALLQIYPSSEPLEWIQEVQSVFIHQFFAPHHHKIIPSSSRHLPNLSSAKRHRYKESYSSPAVHANMSITPDLQNVRMYRSEEIEVYS